MLPLDTVNYSQETELVVMRIGTTNVSYESIFYIK